MSEKNLRANSNPILIPNPEILFRLQCGKNSQRKSLIFYTFSKNNFVGLFSSLPTLLKMGWQNIHRQGGRGMKKWGTPHLWSAWFIRQWLQIRKYVTFKSLGITVNRVSI